MLRGLIVITLLACVSIAHAEDRAKAERYFRLGEKAYQAQNFEAAAQNFEEAYKHFTLAEIAFSAAQAYRRQYRIDPKPEYVQLAVDHYRAYLGKVKSGGRVADAADALAEMQHELDKLIASGVKVSPELAKEHTRILINVTLGKETAGGRMQEVDDDADKSRKVETKVVAELDGKAVEPFAHINVAPGEHKVRVSADGYATQDKTRRVDQGSTAIVDVQLDPKPARVTLKTESSSRVSVNGRPVGTTPMPALELPAGRHVITILHRGRTAVAREVVVSRGQELTVTAPLEHTARRRAVPWILLGAGIAGAIAGTNVVLAVRRDNEAYDLLHLDIQTSGDASPDVLARYDEARLWRDRYATAAWIGGAACVGLAGLAAVLYYTDNPSPDGVRVEPVVGPSGAGAAIAGRF